MICIPSPINILPQLTTKNATSPATILSFCRKPGSPPRAATDHRAALRTSGWSAAAPLSDPTCLGPGTGGCRIFPQELSRLRRAAWWFVYQLLQDVRWDSLGRASVRLYLASCVSLIQAPADPQLFVLSLPQGFFFLPGQKAKAARSQKLFLHFVKA